MLDAMTKQPHPADIAVGARIRLQRQVLGVSQARLGKELGVTFQQVQKYEKGINRVSPSRLQHIADVLGTSISFFFRGPFLTDVDRDDLASIGVETIQRFFETRRGWELAEAFVGVPDDSIRSHIVSLVKAIAANTGTRDDSSV